MMQSSLRKILFTLVLLACPRHMQAQGTAVITLQMPPPGGDGYDALQTGGAFAEGAASLYYNPATLPTLEKATGSQLNFSHSYQELLPVLSLGDLNQEFWGFAAVIPDKKERFDLGIGFFRNEVHFGPNLSSLDTSGDSTFFAKENVYALGIGAALRDLPFSVGFTAKFYDSRLAPGHAGTAQGWAFDFGGLYRAETHPLRKWKISSVGIEPSAGITWQNAGVGVRYGDTGQSDPVPTTLRVAMGVRARLFDMLESEVGEDWEEPRLGGNTFYGATSILGYSVSVLGFRFSVGERSDGQGQRLERDTAYSYEFNVLQVGRIFKRIAHRDFTSSSQDLDQVAPFFPFGKIQLGGFTFRPNPRFVIGKRRIAAYDDGIRAGQKAWYWSLSL